MDEFIVLDESKEWTLHYAEEDGQITQINFLKNGQPQLQFIFENGHLSEIFSRRNRNITSTTRIYYKYLAKIIGLNRNDLVDLLDKLIRIALERFYDVHEISKLIAVSCKNEANGMKNPWDDNSPPPGGAAGSILSHMDETKMRHLICYQAQSQHKARAPCQNCRKLQQRIRRRTKKTKPLVQIQNISMNAPHHQ